MFEASGVHNILGPFEGDRMLVAGIGEPVDGLAHLPRVRRVQVQEHGPGQDAKPDFDLVQPRGMGRSEKGAVLVGLGTAVLSPALPLLGVMSRYVAWGLAALACIFMVWGLTGTVWPSLTRPDRFGLWLPDCEQERRFHRRRGVRARIIALIITSSIYVVIVLLDTFVAHWVLGVVVAVLGTYAIVVVVRDGIRKRKVKRWGQKI